MLAYNDVFWMMGVCFVVCLPLLLLLGDAPASYPSAREARRSAYVAACCAYQSQVNGTVLAVHIADHQTVEADQVLAQLDARDFEARVKQGEAAVAVATANLRRAELEVALTQESTSTETDRTRATLRGAQIATQEAQQRAPKPKPVCATPTPR